MKFSKRCATPAAAKVDRLNRTLCEFHRKRIHRCRRHEIDFVACVWLLWIIAARREDLHQQVPCLKIVANRLPSGVGIVLRASAMLSSRQGDVFWVITASR